MGIFLDMDIRADTLCVDWKDINPLSRIFFCNGAFINRELDIFQSMMSFSH